MKDRSNVDYTRLYYIPQTHTHRQGHSSKVNLDFSVTKNYHGKPTSAKHGLHTRFDTAQRRARAEIHDGTRVSGDWSWTGPPNGAEDWLKSGLP
jgi:nitric oxide synthase oxygenase domain/subunit